MVDHRSDRAIADSPSACILQLLECATRRSPEFVASWSFVALSLLRLSVT